MSGAGSATGRGALRALGVAPPEEVRALGPWGAVGMAAAVAGGALVARPLSLLVPLSILGLAFVVRRPALVVVAAALAASALGARAEEGMAPPAPAPVEGTATLVSDPEVRWGRVEAVARLDGRLVLLEAEGSAAEVVAVRLAGEQVRLAGRLGPPPHDAPWLQIRHVAGAVVVDRAVGGGPGAWPWRAANHLRRLLSEGAAPLGEERRSLFVGLVLGDDREHSAELTDDFRGSGLSHLLAVSGQNVALVMAVALPLLRRLSLTGRGVAVVGLLALFVVLTRGEPSVVRAVAMAGGAVVAAARGRPTSALQLLGLAVAGCLLVDPFLVRSIGFHLSVAATTGIIVVGPHLAAALPGPAIVVAPLAVSASAQLGVAPLVVVSFDGVPVVSLVANVLAAPAAALVMTWGLPAGVVAGVAGPPLDRLVHLPTAAALTWLAGVARTAASAPLGQWTGPHVVVLALAATGAVVASRRPGIGRRVRTLVAVAALVATVQPGVAMHRPPVRDTPAPGIEVWRAGATVVVVGPGTGPTSVLEGLRLAGVTHVDLLVVGGGASAGDEEAAVRHRSRVAAVWWRGRSPPLRVRLGSLEVTAEGDEVRVAPEARRSARGGARRAARPGRRGGPGR